MPQNETLLKHARCRHRLHTDVAQQTTLESCSAAERQSDAGVSVLLHGVSLGTVHKDAEYAIRMHR